MDSVAYLHIAYKGNGLCIIHRPVHSYFLVNATS
jgi:hypothetical protein